MKAFGRGFFCFGLGVPLRWGPWGGGGELFGEGGKLPVRFDEGKGTGEANRTEGRRRKPSDMCTGRL